MSLSPLLGPDMLKTALDKLEPIIAQGENALPTVTLETGHGGPLRIMLAVEPEHMETAFDRVRKILVFKGARSFLLTGHTAEPEGLYAAFIAPGGGAGLFRAIRPGGGFEPDQQLPEASIAPMIEALRPEEGETLDRITEEKIRSALSVHTLRTEPGTPLVIQSDPIA